MPVVGNRIKVSSSSTGTGNIILGSADAGFQTFADGGISNNDVVRYTIIEGSAFEIGLGTYLTTGPTLQRSSSNLLESSTGSLLNLGGSATVFVTLADTDIMQTEGGTFTGNVAFSGNVMPVTDNTGLVGDATYTWNNGRFTNFQVDSTLTVRSYIDLADSDGIRFGSSDDSRFWYNGSTNKFIVEMESACLGYQWTDNQTERMYLEKSTGNLTLTGTVDGRDIAADGTKLDGIESGATADQTITAGSGLTGGGTGNVTISHADTSSQASVNGSGRTYIQDITLDTYGHVTAIGTATETVTDTNTTYALTAAQTGGTDANPNLFLNASSGTDYNVQLVGSGATTVTRNSDGQITISSTDTNTNTNQLTTFQVEDGDGTEVTISHAKEWKFVEGAGDGASIDINWTDTTPGSDADPYDLTFAVTNTDKGSSQNIFKTFTITDTDSGYTWAETGSVVADTNSDTVTFVSGNAINVDVDATNDAIRISATDSPTFATSLTVDGHTLQDSADRSGLLALTTSLGTWRGIQIQPTTTSKWSIMGDQDDFGLYDDENSEWILQYNENSTLHLNANGVNSVTVTTSGLELTAGKKITFEGATNDGYEIILEAADATADRIITLPDKMGTVALDDVATTSADGLMSASDKSKLNGIDASADVNQSAFSYVAVSGQNTVAAGNPTTTLTLAAGSNVTITTNATTDTVTIAAADTNTTSLPIENSGGTVQFTATDATGLQFAAGGSASVAFDATNRRVTYSSTDTNTTYSAGTGLGLSGTTFSIESDLRGDVSLMGYSMSDYIQSTNTKVAFYFGGLEEFRFDSSGNLHADGNVIAYSTTISDPRLKENIKPVTNGLEKVMQLNGYTFEYKADGVSSAGVMSTEVAKVLPSAIKKSKLKLKMGDDNETEYDIVQYDQLTALLIEAIKDLKAEIEELKSASTN